MQSKSCTRSPNPKALGIRQKVQSRPHKPRTEIVPLKRANYTTFEGFRMGKDKIHSILQMLYCFVSS